MTWTRSHSQLVDLPPESLWRVVARVERLPEWNPGIASASLDRPLALGVAGRYRPAGPFGAVHAATAGPLHVGDLRENALLSLVQPQPGGGMILSWRLEKRARGTLVTQTLTQDGPMTPVVVAGLGARLAGDAPVALARLAALAREGVARRVPGRALDRVVVAGGDGLLGTRLAADLTARGLDVVVLARHDVPDVPWRVQHWDGRTGGDWEAVLRDDPARTGLVNLAGASVDARPTQRTFRRLLASRVEPTRALVVAARGGEPLGAWVQGSAVGVWGDAGEALLTEDAPVTDPGHPLSRVVRAWEAAASGANARRVTVLRTAPVLAAGAPLVSRLEGLARAGAGGPVGDGRQWFSWIHVADWLRVVRAALGLDPVLTLPGGVVNAAAPEAVRNAELMAELRRAVGMPVGLPAPRPLATLGAWALGSNPALALDSQLVVPAALVDAGMVFAFPDLASALDDLHA